MKIDIQQRKTDMRLNESTSESPTMDRYIMKGTSSPMPQGKTAIMPKIMAPPDFQTHRDVLFTGLRIRNQQGKSKWVGQLPTNSIQEQTDTTEMDLTSGSMPVNSALRMMEH